MHESGSGCRLFLFSFNFLGREIEVRMENYVLFLVSVLILSYAADKEEVSGVIAVLVIYMI